MLIITRHRSVSLMRQTLSLYIWNAIFYSFKGTTSFKMHFFFFFYTALRKTQTTTQCFLIPQTVRYILISEVLCGKKQKCALRLNYFHHLLTGFLCENKTPIRVKFCLCQHSSLTVMRMTYSISHAALYNHIYARKKLPHKAKIPYFVVKAV